MLRKIDSWHTELNWMKMTREHPYVISVGFSGTAVEHL